MFVISFAGGMLENSSAFLPFSVFVSRERESHMASRREVEHLIRPEPTAVKSRIVGCLVSFFCLFLFVMSELVSVRSGSKSVFSFGSELVFFRFEFVIKFGLVKSFKSGLADCVIADKSGFDP